MSLKTWEEYLFAQHRVVGLSLLANDLRLLDVLLKKGSTGVLNHRPVLVRIGSISTLASEEEIEDWSSTQQEIEEAFENLEAEEDDDDPNYTVFRKDVQGDFNVDVRASSKILLSIQSMVGATLQGCKSLHCNVRNVSFQRVNQDFVMNLVASEPPLWKPDMRKIWLQAPGRRSDKDLELWVVTELKFADKLLFGDSSNYRAGMDVQLAVQPTVSAQVSLADDGSVVVSGSKSGNKSRGVPFAFKAIRLCYSRGGDLISMDSDMGKKRPQRRHGEDLSNLDVDQDPAYHLGGLFVNFPGYHLPAGDDSGAEDDCGLECLEIVTDKSMESAADHPTTIS